MCCGSNPMRRPNANGFAFGRIYAYILHSGHSSIVARDGWHKVATIQSALQIHHTSLVKISKALIQNYKIFLTYDMDDSITASSIREGSGNSMVTELQLYCGPKL